MEIVRQLLAADKSFPSPGKWGAALEIAQKRLKDEATLAELKHWQLLQ